MRFDSLKDLLRRGISVLPRGPVALVFVEDDVELGTTLRHHQHIGFKTVIALMQPHLTLPADLQDPIWRVDHDTIRGAGLPEVVNRLLPAMPTGTWMYYCFNAEYLFFPFCESRSVGEMLAFHAEERRSAMLTYVIDLYADDLEAHPNAVSLDHAHLDKSGYYALARSGPPHGHPKERQLDFFGGLRWRFEEHVPADKRKIDRISLFQAQHDIALRPDFTFSDEEMNTYACPWHHNLTAAVCSFRTAKALKRNPGSTFDIPTFKWHNSAPFAWHSRQLMDLGLMEPGQWF